MTWTNFKLNFVEVKKSMNKKLVGTIVGAFTIGVMVCAIFFMSFGVQLMNVSGNVGVDLETSSIHCRIRVWKGDELILDQHHSGVVTNIGDNQTLYWAFGDADFGSNYDNNVTYISIGNYTGSMNTSVTQLPAEWNRTSATIEDETQSQLNLTCTFYPDSGPYKADCIGLNWASSGDNNLWAYDTFSEVTGIDDTFTINVEFQVSVSHS